MDKDKKSYVTGLTNQKREEGYNKKIELNSLNRDLVFLSTTALNKV